MTGNAARQSVPRLVALLPGTVRETMMNVNIGTLDRILRLVAGLLLAGIGAAMASGGWAIAALAVGAVMILTAVVGFCPAYTLLGIDTRSRRPRAS